MLCKDIRAARFHVISMAVWLCVYDECFSGVCSECFQENMMQRSRVMLRVVASDGKPNPCSLRLVCMYLRNVLFTKSVNCFEIQTWLLL